MLKLRLFLVSCLVFVPLACQRQITKQPDLETKDKRPLYRVSVEDNEEVRLLQQRLGLEVVKVEGHDVYFYATRTPMLDSLKVLGYGPEQSDARQVTYRVVKVARKGTEEEMLQSGVKLINREDEYWIVRGNLSQLKLMSEHGFSLEPLDKEPRPREVQIAVSTRPDVQRAAELGIDIYSVQETTGQGFLIYAGAFDYQIDALRRNSFQVTVRSTVKEGEK